MNMNFGEGSKSIRSTHCVQKFNLVINALMQRFQSEVFGGKSNHPVFPKMNILAHVSTLSRHVIVTGARGQMGALLSRDLAEKGYKVVGLSRNWNACEVTGHAKLDNIDSVKNLLVTFRPCAVYHLAAVQGPSGYPTKPTRQENRLTHSVQNGFLRAMEGAMRETGIHPKFVVAGSSKIFKQSSACKTVYWDSEKETSSAYSKSKYNALIEVDRLRDAGFDAVYGLIFNNDSELRGPGYLTREICHQIATQYSTGKPLRLNLTNSQTSLDWSASKDFAQAYANLLELDWRNNFVLASSVPTTVSELGMIGAGILGRALSILSKEIEPRPSVIARQNDLPNLGILERTPPHEVLSEMLKQEFGTSITRAALNQSLHRKTIRICSHLDKPATQC